MAKYGAVESLTRLLRFLTEKTVQSAFGMVKLAWVVKKAGETSGKDSGDVTDLLKRNSVLLEEKRMFKE